MSQSIAKNLELQEVVSRVWRELNDHREFGEWLNVKLDGPFVPGKVSNGRITYPGYEHLTFELVTQKIEPERRFAVTRSPYAPESYMHSSEEPSSLGGVKL